MCVAVGNHLLVGGDNMDLALAHFVAGKFTEKGINLDPWQSVSLWHQCRAAKEALLAEGGPKKHSISVLGRGSKLIGSTLKVYPVAYLPRIAAQAGARLVILNAQATPLDPAADAVLSQPIGDVLPRLVELA